MWKRRKKYLKGDKPYVISSRDLSPGQQATQAAHALTQFHFEHPKISSSWYHDSQFLCLLSVANLEELDDLWLEVKSLGLNHSAWMEPDWYHELTAIAAVTYRTTPLLVLIIT